MSAELEDIIRQIAETCERAAAGDMEARLIGLSAEGDVARLVAAINRVLDVSDAYVRESAAAMGTCAGGRYHRPILLRGMPGIYRTAATRINDAALKMKTDAERIAAFEVERRKVAGEVNVATNEVGALSEEIDNTAVVLLKNAEQTKRLSASVSDSAVQTAGSVTAIAAACEELTSTTTEIARQTQHATALTTSAVSESDDACKAVGGLEEATRKVESIINFINKIARQTKLLALNATIEAARAGDAGRGFAVVANEVKTLSQDTSSATETISGHVETMRTATSRVMKSITGISASIKKMNTSAGTISKSVEEQVQATAEISVRINEASMNARTISTTIESVTQAAKETENASVELKQASAMLAKQTSVLRTTVAGLQS